MSDYNKLSLERLESCHEKLRDLWCAAKEITPILVTCGYRNEIDQNEAFANGTSTLKWPDSKHNSFPSKAIDCCPLINGQPMLHDREQIIKMAGVIITCAKIKSIPIRWGGDWRNEGSIGAHKPVDLYHFELI